MASIEMGMDTGAPEEGLAASTFTRSADVKPVAGKNQARPVGAKRQDQVICQVWPVCLANTGASQLGTKSAKGLLSWVHWEAMAGEGPSQERKSC